MATIQIDLDDFETDDLVEELESRCWLCEKGSGNANFSGVTELDLERIEHLSVCGQRDAARQEALQIVGRAIQRNLAH